MERDKRLAWDEYQAHLCECGLPEELADEDPELEVVPRVCPICAGLAKHVRVMTAEDEKAKAALGEKPPPGADLPDDGRHLKLRPKMASRAGGGDVLAGVSEA